MSRVTEAHLVGTLVEVLSQLDKGPFQVWCTCASVPFLQMMHVLQQVTTYFTSTKMQPLRPKSILFQAHFLMILEVLQQMLVDGAGAGFGPSFLVQSLQLAPQRPQYVNFLDMPAQQCAQISIMALTVQVNLVQLNQPHRRTLAVSFGPAARE